MATPPPVDPAPRPAPAGEVERARVTANLRVSLAAGTGGALLGLVANGLAGRTASVVPLAGLVVVLAAARALANRGREGWAAALALSGLVTAIDALLVVGQGIHDRAALLFPVVILVAGLTFDRRLLAATTAACIASAGAVTLLEVAGVLPPSPFRHALGWLPLVDVTIILVVTAVAVDLLVADVRRGLREAREKGDRLAEANRELAARNAELERFAYVVSHDLKSPLVTIRGFLGYVEKDAREGRLDRLGADLDRVRNASARMGQLLDDLLLLARTGRVSRAHRELVLADAVDEALSLVAGPLAARRVKVVVERPLPLVHGDRRQVVDLMQNLLENAAKFMGAQEEPLVRVSARPAGDGLVEVTVSDNGIGLDPAHHEAVFEPFYRLDPGPEGSGLGLSLARRIVEAHGGTIGVRSEGAGRGAAFVFTLRAANRDR